MYQIWFNFIAINENFVVLCYSPRARKMFVLPMSSETGWCQCYANILWIQTQPQLVSSWSCLQCTNPPQRSKEQRWRSTWYDRTGQVLVYLLYSYLRPCLHESDAKVERYVCISLSVFFCCGAEDKKCSQLIQRNAVGLVTWFSYSSQDLQVLTKTSHDDDAVLQVAGL